jgi:hypothetical protein
MRITSYINSGKLRSLHPILKEWIRLNRHYSKTVCRTDLWDDCAWWANERASTGTLAAAAWTKGWVALEEYSTRKIRKKTHGNGRCDLFFTVGKNKFASEIKQVFPRINKNNLNVLDVQARFKQACEDAKKLFPKEGQRLGICFVTPRFPPSQIEHIDYCLENYLDCLLKNQKKLNFHAVAWYFPKEARKMRWPENKRTYPGIIILIRRILRSR